jgi:hypothetical protein
MTKRYFLHKASKVVVYEDIDLLPFSHEWVEHPYLLTTGLNVQVVTTFRARDARDEGLGLGHIAEPLVFETLIKRGEFMGTRTFWSTHEQAMAGHEYWIMKHKVGETRKLIDEMNTIAVGEFTEAYLALSRLTEGWDNATQRVRDLIQSIGAESIYDLTRSANYVAADRSPVTLPISGYQSDIERFIQL